MNYIWELILEADRIGMERERLHFLRAVNPSPYLEISFEDLNTNNIEEPKIEVNPLYRFADLFSGICDVNIDDFEDIRAFFFDICLHYIAQLDFREGLSRQDFYLYYLTRELKEGIFGCDAKSVMLLFTSREIQHFMIPFLHLYRSQNYVYEFGRAIRGVYPHSYLYVSNDRACELLLYLGVKETEKEKRRIKFLIDGFLPVQYRVHLFYDYHFGIIGVDETMVLDDMVIF